MCCINTIYICVFEILNIVSFLCQKIVYKNNNIIFIYKISVIQNITKNIQNV